MHEDAKQLLDEATGLIALRHYEDGLRKLAGLPVAPFLGTDAEPRMEHVRTTAVAAISRRHDEAPIADCARSLLADVDQLRRFLSNATS